MYCKCKKKSRNYTYNTYYFQQMALYNKKFLSLIKRAERIGDTKNAVVYLHKTGVWKRQSALTG